MEFLQCFLSIKSNFISPLCPQNHTNDIFENYLFHQHRSYITLSIHYSNDQFPYYYPPSALLDLNLTEGFYKSVRCFAPPNRWTSSINKIWNFLSTTVDINPSSLYFLTYSPKVSLTKRLKLLSLILSLFLQKLLPKYPDWPL